MTPAAPAPAHAPIDAPEGLMCTCGRPYDGSMACRAASRAAKAGRYINDGQERRQFTLRAGINGDSASNVRITSVRA